VLLGNGGGPGRGSNEVTSWIQANGTLVDAAAYGGAGGQQLYDLSVAQVGPALTEST
jgi:hypothetical protein